VVLAVLFGLALEWLLFRHFYHRDHLDQVLLTFGLIYIFEELRSMLWGDDVHGVPSPTFCWRLDPADRQPVLPGLPAVHVGRVHCAGPGPVPADLQTRLGMKIRAGAFNRDMTEALGVNIKLIHAVVFAWAWAWRRWPA
jgi:branched-chain amino acid transport system permease protein